MRTSISYIQYYVLETVSLHGGSLGFFSPIYTHTSKTPFLHERDRVPLEVE